MQTDTRVDGLHFDGRSAVSREYMALRERHLELVRAVRAIERERDAAGRDVQRLSAELAQLERERAAGGDVAGRLTKATKALALARAAAGSAWHEKLTGSEAAARDAAAAVARFAGANYPALAAELREDAHAAKERGDEVLVAVGDVHREHSAVSQRFTALAGLVGLREVNLVPESRFGGLSRDAARLLRDGGQVPAIPRHEPTTAEPVAS